MHEVITNIIHVFNESKLSGSYFFLYLLCLFVLYRVNKEKSQGFLLYRIGILVVVIFNPITIWLIARIFPAMTTYTPFILLIPILIYLPYTCVELFECLKDYKKKLMLMVLIFVIIAISGNVFGLYQINAVAQNLYTNEKKQIIQALDDKDFLILADESIAPYMRSHASNIQLLYGKDLWTPGLDTGIMDEYNEDMLSLYEAMKNPEECIGDIVATASIYECDIIVVKNFDSYKDLYGSYELQQETEHYLVYGLQ